jgi:hypothetical protein
MISASKNSARHAVVLAICLGLTAAARVADAQVRCRFFCTPQLLIEPTWTIENLAKRTRVRTPAGEEVRYGRETVFETIFAIDIPTSVPRLGFTAEAIVVPFTTDNAVELELETNIELVKPAWTKGWVGSHVDIVDKFSPAERPTDRRAYTHKLNFEWDTSVAAFKWLPDRHWLRGIEIEGSLDYVATGLPKSGDTIDGDQFLTAASPWSFSVVLVIPITP